MACFLLSVEDKDLLVQIRLAETTLVAERETNRSLSQQYQAASAGPLIKVCCKPGRSLHNLQIAGSMAPVPTFIHLVSITNVSLAWLFISVCSFQS